MNKFNLLVITALLSTSIAKSQWTITNGPTEPNTSCLAANDVVLLAGCSSASSNQGGHRSLDQGDTWFPTGTTALSKFTALAVNPTSGIVYAGGNNGFYQSFDDGATFTNSNNGLAPYTTRDIIIEGNNIYASTSGVYLSTNGGFNWNSISPALNSVKIDKSGSTIVAGTFDTGVHLSLDNGLSWTNPTSGIPTNIKDVKIVGSNLLAATSTGVYISYNNGLTWTQTNLTNSTNCFHQIGSVLFAGCAANGVFYSNDGGNIWIGSSTGMGNITVTSLTSNSNYIFAGTNGSVYRRSLSDYGIITNTKTDISIMDSFLFFPNPSEGSITLEHNFHDDSELEIFNQLGKLVLTKKIIEPNLCIDITNLAKGVYSLRLKSNNSFSISKKLVLK
jgi:hypothetical protein